MCFFCVSRVGRPQRKVIAKQLHDEGRVFVGLLGQSVQLRDRVVECLFGWSVSLRVVTDTRPAGAEGRDVADIRGQSARREPRST